ncbi:MAG: glycine betaine/L-proline ABC transporter ATP-binding protein [Dehalococcoidia bacterium]
MNNKIKKNDYHLTVKNLWKVFGDDPLASLSEEYLLKSRSEIQSEIGQLIALRNISFNVKRGETFVVMGLSGSGKSTLVRCLIRLIEKTSGNISVDGEDINSFDDKNLMDFRRNKVSMVFQNFGLLPHRNVIDNACYGLEIKGIPKRERYKIAKKMISLVGLDGWEYSKVSELSGGMQQRVGLARALAVEPEILLLDEPFSGLDPLIRRQMRSELVDLQKKLKKTMVFITHDLDEAIAIGDTIAIMRDGEIIQMGAPEEIILNPADKFVAEFTEDVSKENILSTLSISVKPDLIWNFSSGFDELKNRMGNLEIMHIAFVDDEAYSLGVLMRSDVDQSESMEDIKLMLKKSLPSISSTSSLKSAIASLADSETPIPIVDSREKFVGVATQSSILKALKKYQTEEIV